MGKGNALTMEKSQFCPTVLELCSQGHSKPSFSLKGLGAQELSQTYRVQVVYPVGRTLELLSL